MKKIILQFTFILLTVNGYCQTTFSEMIYDSLQFGVQACSVIPAFDNGYMIAGETSGNANVIKIDSAGNLLWNKEYGTNGNSEINTIIATNDSCFIIAGGHNSDAFCAKINQNGDTLWLKTIQTGGTGCIILSIQQTIDSGYIMTGNVDYNNAPHSRIFTTKLDLSGNLQWSNIIRIGTLENFPYSIKQTPDSGYIVTGYIENDTTFLSYTFLLKLSSSGTISWANKYSLNTAYTWEGFDLMNTNNGYLIYLSSNNSLVLMQTDFSGNIIWNKTYIGYGGNNNINFPSPKIHKTFDGGFVFVTKGDNLSGGIIIKTDSMGNYLWSKYLLFASVDVVESRDSGLLIVGNGPMIGVGPITVYSPQIGIIKTDSIGNANNCINGLNVITSFDTIIISAANYTTLINGTASPLYPNINSVILKSDSGCVSFLGGINQINSSNEITLYPNPTSGTFTIIYNSSSIILNSNFLVFDVTGRKVYSQQITNPTESTIQLNQLSDGIYYWEMMGTNGIEGNGKIVLIRD